MFGTQVGADMRLTTLLGELAFTRRLAHQRAPMPTRTIALLKQRTFKLGIDKRRLLGCSHWALYVRYGGGYRIEQLRRSGAAAIRCVGQEAGIPDTPTLRTLIWTQWQAKIPQ